MNRIHRRVWSTAHHCWVVASELSKSQGKASQVIGAGALAAVLILATSTAHAADEDPKSDVSLEQSTQQWAIQAAFAATAAAPATMAAPLAGVMASPITRQVSLTTDYSYRDSTVSGDLLVVLGSRSTLSGNRSVAYGSLITSRGDNNTAIGNGVQITGGGYATGVGASAVASGIGATALGNEARAYSQNSIAVGSGSRTHEDTGGISRIAIGGDAFAGTAGWTGAIALGGAAAASHDSVAVGYEAKTTASGAVALGRGALASEANTVSVGNATTKRRIVNVADARLSSTSTDAVNGRQLHTVSQNAATALSTANTALANTRLVTQTSASSTIRIGMDNTGTVLDVSNRSGTRRRVQNIANGVLSTTSTDAVTGQQLNATNTNVTAASTTATNAHTTATAAKTAADSALAKATVATNTTATGTAITNANKATATGTGALASGTSAKAQGTHATALGFSAQATANQATAVGRESAATGSFATALGNLAKAGGGSALALGDRSSATHTNAVALGAGSETYSNNSVSVGNATTKRKIQYVADGTIGAGSTDAVTGSQLHATNSAVTTAQTTATSAQTTAVAAQRVADSVATRATTLEGLVSQTAAAGNVRLGAQNTGTTLDVRNKSNANRKISGVADATLSATSTEAVTGKQLNATNTNVTAAQNTATTAQTAATTAQRTADGVVTRATALEGLVSQVSASGDLRLGAQNTGTTLDLRNRSNAARKLSGVADGALGATSTEAVTGKQLFGTQQKVTANERMLATHSSQLSGQDGRITDNRHDLDELRTEFENFDPDLDGVVKFAADGSIDLNGGKVRGVAPGDISSAGSTEAVNGGQLFATNQRVSAIESANQFVRVFSDGESEAAEAGLFGVAMGDGARASLATEGGTAIGSFTSADGRNSVALGRGANVGPLGDEGFAMGVGTNVYAADGVALGAYARVESNAVSSVALGAGSIADTAGTVSLGHASLQRRLVNVARGTGKDDAANVAQLRESVETLGGGAHVDSNGDVIAPSYDIQGGTKSTVGDALSALDSAIVKADARVGSVENQLRSVFQDDASIRSDGLSQLNLAGANGMVLGNVANGLIAPGSRDAVNGGQLHAMEQRLDGRIDGLEQRVDTPLQGREMATASAPTPPVAEEEGSGAVSGTPEAASAGDGGGRIASADDGGTPANADAPAPAPTPTPQVSTAELEKMLARANEYSDGISREVDRRLDKMDKRFNRMAAMSSAQTAMAMNTAGLATYNRLGAGVGYAEGESAMAVGYQRVLNDKGSATFSLNGAFTNSGERSMGVGVGIGW